MTRTTSPTRSVAEGPAQRFDWGAITWLCNGELMPGTAMTLGHVVIEPGRKNPRHLHPNCEELLYLISGELDHSLGDDVVHLTAGTAIRIPVGTPHDAINRGSERAVMVVAYSTPDRQTIICEGQAGGAPQE